MTKNKRPELDLDAEAQAALDEARDMPQGPERTAALKKAGILRKAAEEARLDIVRDYHVDLAQRFADEATQIPRRAATLARFHEREKQVTWELARADLREAR